MPQKPCPLSLKPDLEEAAKRWDAFYAGDLIDRPIVWVQAPRSGCAKLPPAPSYRDKVFGDMDTVIDKALLRAEATYWGGEAIPVFYPTLGPDEIAVYCGAELRWSSDSDNTNWSVPFVEDWESALPLAVHEENPLWQRVLDMYRRAAQRLAGKMLVAPLDLHTNLDLLTAVRGPDRICLDMFDRPDLIDLAMADARTVFRRVWEGITEAGRMDERGYCDVVYSMQGAAILQSDHSNLISPAMFRRWVRPALDEEAGIVRHALYHWDGPRALVHIDELLAIPGLLALEFTVGAVGGSPVDYMWVYKRVQEGGKAVNIWGTPDEIKAIHPQLRPEKAIYCTTTASQAEADELLEWFRWNT